MSIKPGQRSTGRADWWTMFLLFVFGLWIIFGYGPLGWNTIREQGLEDTVLRVCAGFLFLFVAGLVMEKNRMRQRISDIHEAMNMLLYGKDYRRDREAIRILLTALGSSDGDVRAKAWRSLKELTGRDFACDASVWQSWWQANEQRFALRKKRPED